MLKLSTLNRVPLHPTLSFMTTGVPTLYMDLKSWTGTCRCLKAAAPSLVATVEGVMLLVLLRVAGAEEDAIR